MTNLIEPVLALAEGVALIASPCILPVLPLVLSASIDGGRKDASLQMNFKAKKLFLVLGTATGKPIHATVHVNGEVVNTNNSGQDVKDGQVTVTRNTLYELVDQKITQNGLFEIEASEPGLEAYAFTFGE